MTVNASEKLASLARSALSEMEATEAIGRSWLEAPVSNGATPAHNVVICGAGLSGLGIAFGLRRRGVRGVIVLDENPRGAEGPWVTSARMKTLRSPKHLAGLDFGIPSLTARAWYEAAFGDDSWQSLGKIGRHEWMDYLTWYRDVTGAEVLNGTRLTGIRHKETLDGSLLELDIEDGSGSRRMLCRRLVLATGMEGCGGPHVPSLVADLPRSTWSHSCECRDCGFLKDKSVVVLGASTSGFDWAVAALEAGAARVTMLGRSRSLPRTEVLDWSNFPGFLVGYADLPDEMRWAFARRYFTLKPPPTQDQFDRAIQHPNFELRLGCPVIAATYGSDRLELETASGQITADHLLLGTGYELDLARRPELAALTEGMVLWRDRLTWPDETALDRQIGAHPYLGPAFEFTSNSPEHAWINRVHLFNGGALPSLGPISNGVTGIKYGLPRIVDGVVKALFAEESGRFLSELAGYCHAHFDPRGRDKTNDNGEEA
ncbi:MAG: NAD(P)/FAD-dependent oxidoreductase [Ancalomicrobiaceae bacterium]|nr:NAD(P)/FAD-dependent oxidoreductase [Ancalomicrobiaceae bacterium]